MLMVERIITELGRGALAGRERDCVVMTSEERRWARRRVRSVGGRELALALPTGTVMAPGALLAVAPQWYIEVEAAEEPVLAITPFDADAAVRIAFEVGNHHFSLAIDSGLLLVPDDPALEQLLTRIGARWRRERRVFDPIGRGHRHEH